MSQLYYYPNYGPHKKAYHRAVDLFYDALAPAKRGAPSYPPEFIEKLRQLNLQGKSHGEIALMLDLPTTPPDELQRSKDRVRKLIKRSASKATPPISSPGRKQK